MRTKGIRQAEGESPYTVKTKGAIWWKEEDPTFSQSSQQPGREQTASSWLHDQSTQRSRSVLEAETKSD